MIYCFHNSYSILNRHYPRKDKKKEKELTETKKKDLTNKKVHFEDE